MEKCPFYNGKYNSQFYGIRCKNAKGTKTVEITSRYLPTTIMKSDVRYTQHYRDKYIEDRCFCDFKTCQVYKN